VTELLTELFKLGPLGAVIAVLVFLLAQTQKRLSSANEKIVEFHKAHTLYVESSATEKIKIIQEGKGEVVAAANKRADDAERWAIRTTEALTKNSIAFDAVKDGLVSLHNEVGRCTAAVEGLEGS